MGYPHSPLFYIEIFLSTKLKTWDYGVAEK